MQSNSTPESYNLKNKHIVEMNTTLTESVKTEPYYLHKVRTVVLDHITLCKCT